MTGICPGVREQLRVLWRLFVLDRETPRETRAQELLPLRAITPQTAHN